MATFKVRYLTERKTPTKTYHLWQPSAELRPKGWKAVSLVDAYGRPSGLPVAMMQAAWLNAMLDAWRLGDQETLVLIQQAWAKGEELTLPEALPRSALPERKGSPGSSRPKAGSPVKLIKCDYVHYKLPGVKTRLQVADPAKRTVAALIALFKESDEWKALADKTQAGYRSNLEGPKNNHSVAAVFGSVPVKALTRKMFRDFYKKVAENFGRATANAHIRAASVLLSFAVEEEWRGDNPLLAMHGKKFNMIGTKPRVVIWRPQETEHLARVGFDEIGEHGIADACYIALSSCQRQGDVITLPRLLFQSDHLALSQSKRGALVDIDYTPALAARVEIMKARREKNGWEHVPTMIVDDHTGRPFVSSTFAHRFLAGKRLAAETMPAIKRAPGELDFLDKQFMDFRDTGITRVALAQLDMYGVIDMLVLSSISGHKLQSITGILKHYIAMDKAMADRGIAALSHYMKQKGIAV